MNKTVSFLGRNHLVTILAAVFTVVFLLVGIYFNAFAAITTGTATNPGMTQATTIKASSTPTAVIGINLVASAGETFASTTISINPTNSFASSTDFAPLSVATSSGIAVYKDNKTGGVPGLFDATDMVVTLSGVPVWIGATTTLEFAVAQVIPTDNNGPNTGTDYFVVIQTGLSAVNGHAVSFNIYPGTLAFTPTTASIPAASFTSNVFTIDTVAPAISAIGPTNGATNVPISSMIGVMFNENMDFSTLNSTNVTLTTGGNPVGASLNTNPTGFNVVISSPPIYAPASLFTKVTSTVFGFFMIMPSQPVFPQGGSYTAPTAGDIVYFQHDTFPPELGIVTDATLTGGTFKINDFALMGGQSITKFSTASSTGAVTASTNLNLGDLLVANTTANPTTDRYGWHIVTGSAPINNTFLRLDGAGVLDQPTFVSGSSFSMLTPTASTTDNGATGGGVLAVTRGDLVFAKVFGGSYGWHIASTTGNLSSVEAEGTAVLDNLSTAYASLVASSSQMSKLSTSASGAITETATTFSNGDLVFAKTTANSGINGAYAFHLISRGNDGTGGAASTNLRFDNTSANLSTGATYTLTIGTGVKDRAGNPLASPSVTTFTTGSTGSTNTAPAFVTSSNPTMGTQNFPTGAPIRLVFSQDMSVVGGTSGANSVTNPANVVLALDNFGAPGASVTATRTYDSASRTLTITPASALTASTGYVVRVINSAQSATGGAAQEFFLNFRTASGADSTRPKVMGTFPNKGAVGVNLPVNDIGIGFSETIDASTISASTITISPSVAGTVSYDPQSSSAHFSPSATLSTATTYTVTVATGVTDLSANGLEGNAGVANAANTNSGASSSYVFSFTTWASTDSVAPAVAMANADNFGIAVTFSEAMKSGGGPNAADNIANYTLESPTGSSISLGGKTVAYDGKTQTAKISGLSLQNGNSFKIIVSTLVQDISSNALVASENPGGNVAFGTVANSAMTGGQLGPGSGPQQDPGVQGMSPVRVSPTNRSMGATSDYSVEFPVSTSIPSGGRIVLTFPVGFDVTGAIAATAGTQSFRNSDVNGPASGVITIQSVTANTSARTVSVVTTGAATGANSFISFDLKGIINSTLPSAAGYTVDIKTKDETSSATILESKTSAPFFLGAAGTNALTVTVFSDNGAGGGTAGNKVKDGSEPGIVGAKLFLSSPASGGLASTTITGGVATFSNLANGDYMLGIDPSSVGNLPVNSAPQMITISGNTAKSIAAGGFGSALTISGTVTGPNGTKVDVFGSSNNGFTKTSLTLTGGADAYTLPAQASTTYQIGVGPSMPDSFFAPGSPPPPPPVFTFMPPPNLDVQVNSSNITGKNFVLSATSKTITGSVLDSTGSGVSGAGIFARPVSDSTTAGSSVGFGTGGQTGVDGSFSLNVVPGVYLVGVFKPGMPSVPDKQITVPATGANTPTSLTFKLNAGTSLTITGSVKDDNGNVIPYAGVSGRKVTSTSDTSLIGGGTQNFVGGQTDVNGAYTLYVSAGTWVLESFAPGFGKLGTKTVTVSSTSLSGQDFSAQNLTLNTISGQATKASVAQQGVMVRAEGSNGVNMAATDNNGNYSLKVPAGSYTITCMFPGVGESTPLAADASLGNVTNKDCTLAAPITITVDLTDGTSPIQNAFVDVRDSNGRGNGTSISTTTPGSANAVYTINVPPGTYTVRAGHPAYGTIGSTSSVNTTGSITYTASAGQMVAVSGTVSDAGAIAINGAWVTLIGTPTGQTNIINMGAQTNNSGAYTINIPAGSYRLRADKPGYKSPAEADKTITAVSTGNNVTLTAATKTITGTVTLSSAGVSGAFVDAVDGAGGFAVAQTDSAGAYSLAIDTGTWTLHARSIGYEGTLSNVTVSGSNVSGQTIALSAMSGFTVKQERQETITPTSGGLVTNSDISGFKMNIPANALGTGSNAGTVKTQNNTAVPNPSTGTVLSKNAVTISAIDSSGQPIKTLNDNVTIVVPYDDTNLTVAQESSLVLGVWNDATQSYDSLPTTVNATGNTLTATVSHFSDFVPLVSSNTGSVVATPAATVTTSSGGGGGGIMGSSGYVSPIKARPQIVYPDGHIVYLDETPVLTTNNPTSSSGVSSSQSYSRFLTIGSKGDDVTSLQTFLEDKGFLTIPPGVAKGYFGNITKNALAAYQKSVRLPAVGVFGPMTMAKLNSTSASPTAPSTNLTGATGSQSYSRFLTIGSKGDDVTSLQTFLEDKGFLTIPPGVAKGYFGNITKNALAAYQGSVGIDPLGIVGPATRAKLNSESQ